MWYYLIAFQITGAGYMNVYTVGEFKGEKSCTAAIDELVAGAKYTNNKTFGTLRCVPKEVK
jgi:hypothetical protein